jgi:hypothetical protein
MTTYSQPKMLGVQFDTIRSYPKDILDRIELSIGDDHGTPEVEIPEDVKLLLPCQLFRALEDIHWNQPGMRNLLLEHVRTPLVLFVDVDMTFPPGMMRMMLAAGDALPRGCVVRFCLRHRGGPSKGKIDRSSPNTWFAHAADLRRIQGYNEDYCGAKGWSDVELLDIVKSVYRVMHVPSLFAEFYGTDEIEDAAVSTLDRSTARNKKIRVNNVRVSKQMGGWLKFAKRPVPRLRFKWERRW